MTSLMSSELQCGPAPPGSGCLPQISSSTKLGTGMKVMGILRDRVVEAVGVFGREAVGVFYLGSETASQSSGHEIRPRR